MKFTPVASTSPRVLRRDTIDGDPPIHLELIHDPKDGKEYLSIGIGEKTIRRSWLSRKTAFGLLRSVTSMMEELRRD